MTEQNLWTIASNVGHKLLWQIYPFKAVLYLEENCLLSQAHKNKEQANKKNPMNQIPPFRMKLTEINLVIKTEIKLPSEKRKKCTMVNKSQAKDFQFTPATPLWTDCALLFSN